jgi:RNA polymerase-binding transcription factor DksA
MATKERQPPQAGQAPVRPGHAQDPAWAGGAPELAQAGRARGPAWRALLEAQWRDRLQTVTELSLAYHEAASVTAAVPSGQPAARKVRRLLRRAVAARQALADTEEALGRLASGRYGLCEGCAAAIPARLLAAVPDTRYCPRCRPRPARTPGTAPAMAGRPALSGG